MAESQGNVVRLLPYFAGGVAGIMLLLNRLLLTPSISDSQARSDVVGTIASAVLILIGLIWQQIQPKLPESVILEGEEGLEIDPSLSMEVSTELAWATHIILTNTATKSIAVYAGGRVLIRRGILGKNKSIVPGTILKRVLETQKPVYLVDLKLYPGRIEFDYLPANIQGVICQPIGTNGAIVLGSNAPRSYTKQDEKWIAGIADKLAHTLEK
jgi:hypothetical protein